MRATAFILALFASAEAYKYGYNHPPFLKDDEIAASYFPNIDTKLLCPAFLHPETWPAGFSNGTQGPTSLDIPDSYIKAIDNKNSSMTCKRFTFVSEECRRLPYLLLSNNPEALTVTSAVFAPAYYEGYVPVTLTTEIATRHLELPAGSFLVSTRQRNAGLEFVALEPENVDSWTSSNMIPVQPGDEHPAFRVMA